jgi:outer membrane lipoprotein-sorting protein
VCIASQGRWAARAAKRVAAARAGGNFSPRRAYPGAAWAQTADEIVEKNIQARGGKDKIKAVQTVRMTGKMTVGPGMEAPFTLEMARPAKARMEFSLQGMTAVQAFDGKTGWAVMPFLGKTEPEVLPAEELSQMEEQSDLDGALVDYKAKGHQVEYLGKADYEGTPVHKLKVTLKAGKVVTYFVDAESFLELKTESKNKIQGQEVDTETVVGDYKEVGGVLFAHSMQSKIKGGQNGMTMTIDKIEVNPEVAATRFEMPKKEAVKPPQQ